MAFVAAYFATLFDRGGGGGAQVPSFHKELSSCVAVEVAAPTIFGNDCSSTFSEQRQETGHDPRWKDEKFTISKFTINTTGAHEGTKKLFTKTSS